MPLFDLPGYADLDEPIPFRWNHKTYFARIGIVSDVSFLDDDHGSISSFVTIDLSGGGTQGAGGFSLGDDDGEFPSIRLSQWWWMLVHLFGLDFHKTAKGKLVLALYEDDQHNSFIRGLAHITDRQRVYIFNEILSKEEEETNE